MQNTKAAPVHLSDTSRPYAQCLAGLALVAVIAAVATGLARFEPFASHGFSALTLSMVIGIAVGNSILPKALAATSGVTFAKQWLLRAGIVLYGFRLTFADVAQVGVAGIAIDAVMLASTFALACWLGVRVLKLDRPTAMLIGAGSAICGAAAVMAAAPVVRGRSEQVAVAVSMVVLFGTVSMFVTPVLYDWVVVYIAPVSQVKYGVFMGSTIHEVAQVVAAGHAVSDSAASAAVITKMVRVMMLAPFLLWLSVREGGRTGDDEGDGHPDGRADDNRRRVVVPWFAVGFIGITALNSIHPLPAAWAAACTELDIFMLAMAMAALGLNTHLISVARTGMRPVLLAALLFTWLIVGGMIVNLGVWLVAGP